MNTRGRVVQLSKDAEDAIGSAHALIVAEPTYSLEERYLNVIPLHDADVYQPTKADVVIEEEDESALNYLG